MVGRVPVIVLTGGPGGREGQWLALGSPSLLHHDPCIAGSQFLPKHSYSDIASNTPSNAITFSWGELSLTDNWSDPRTSPAFACRGLYSARAAPAVAPLFVPKLAPDSTISPCGIAGVSAGGEWVCSRALAARLKPGPAPFLLAEPKPNL